MKWLLVIAALALSGCGLTQTGDFVRSGAVTQGAKAYDEGVANAEWFLCQAASVGSIKRHYGVSKEKSAAYNLLCKAEGAANIITGPAP